MVVDERAGTTIDRRSFLRKSTAVGSGVFAAALIGSLSPGLLRIEGNASGLSPDGHGAHDGHGGHGGHDDKPHGHGFSGSKLERLNLSPLSLDGVQTRLGILSDAHICDYDLTALGKLTAAWETLAWAAPGISAHFLLGDVTLNGTESEMDLFATQTAETLMACYATVPTTHLLMGNHDWLGCGQTQFESYFAGHDRAQYFASKQDTVELVGGATIIKLNGSGVDCAERDMMDYTVAYDFLAAALEETTAHRPDDAILVMAHEPPMNRGLLGEYECGYYGQGTSLDMVELMTRYPQLRLFSGHIHNPLDMPETINTDLGFTSVYTSTVGSCLFVRGELVGKQDTDSQGLVLDIMEDGRLVLHRLIFNSREYLGQPVEL
ncbi:MAG: metallophosphoesterase [Coriobacteriales bacterium]|jgi:hypothetical protein|nr:metallophosphoesterase [Coriobacteriales bacterium]